VYFGGTLIQDLDNANAHTSKAGYDLIHPVHAAEGSVVHALYGGSFVVNSSHHQAIGVLGNGLTVTMTTENPRVIEGIAHETLPVLAVQWHPERMCFEKERSDTVNGAALIQYFVDLCKTM
jgi:putative glutamine amidotransferase